MCTGLTLSTKDGKHFFGRNLDVPASYGQAVHIIPRNFNWTNVVTGETLTSKYSCIAMAIVVDNHPLLFDGVNEKGLAGGGLNFTHFAKFSDEAIPGKTNISAADFLYWALGNFSNLTELREALQNLVLTNIPVKENLPVSGLHWMFTDLSGKSIIVENMDDGMHIYDNPVGTLTNDPTFPWHLTNLRQYVTIDTKTPQPRQMGDVLMHPFGHGLNMCGLPGDASPASRFVRTVFFRDSIVDADDEISGVTAFLNVLTGVTVLKGSEVDPDGSMNYTVYKSAMCQETGTYYYTDYYNRRINAIKLNNADLDGKEIVSFSYNNKQDILFQN
ncbi:MAG: choloylglycine hydrolase [Turicibacter sp.]|nr:choloylglycine hydrolase [Turicibacter sp.]